VSWCTDYQSAPGQHPLSRRLGCPPVFVHTLNGSAIAWAGCGRRWWRPAARPTGRWRSPPRSAPTSGPHGHRSPEDLRPQHGQADDLAPAAAGAVGRTALGRRPWPTPSPPWPRPDAGSGTPRGRQWRGPLPLHLLAGRVAAFYGLPEERASKGVADWRMLRRKLPDESSWVGGRCRTSSSGATTWPPTSPTCNGPWTPRSTSWAGRILRRVRAHPTPGAPRRPGVVGGPGSARASVSKRWWRRSTPSTGRSPLSIPTAMAAVAASGRARSGPHWP